MKRTIQQWRNCDPSAMVTQQSQAALTYALEDAKADIEELYRALECLIYLRHCIETGHDPAMSGTNAAILQAMGETE